MQCISLLQRLGNPISFVKGEREIKYIAQGNYQVSPNLDPPLGFNVTHDNALVALAFSSESRNPPAFSVGIDVMKLRIPGKESFPSFVHTVGDQVS